MLYVEAVTAGLIFRMSVVKKEANLLHAQVDWSSAATDTGGFVSLSMVANKHMCCYCFWLYVR